MTHTGRADHWDTAKKLLERLILAIMFAIPISLIALA